MWVVSLCTLYHTIIITNMTLCHLLCVICTQITSYSLNHFKRHTFWFFTVWKEYFVQRIAMRDVLNHESLTMKVFRRPNPLIYFDSDLELSITSGTVSDIFVREVLWDSSKSHRRRFVTWWNMLHIICMWFLNVNFDTWSIFRAETILSHPKITCI